MLTTTEKTIKETALTGNTISGITDRMRLVKGVRACLHDSLHWLSDPYRHKDDYWTAEDEEEFLREEEKVLESELARVRKRKTALNLDKTDRPGFLKLLRDLLIIF